MSERKMTPKGFLHKANGKIGPAAFLAQHRAWLETGELAYFTSPILRKLDDAEVLPTPALDEIKAVVLAHHLASEVAKGEAAMEKAGQPQTSKNYMATIYDSKGNVCTKLNDKGKEVPLRQSFDSGSDADGWVDRRLFEGESDWFGTVASTKLFKADGDPFTITVCRQDAIARILKQKKGSVMKSKPQSASRLGFGVKAKQSHCHFSKG
jgi:hypothetical protein